MTRPRSETGWRWVAACARAADDLSIVDGRPATAIVGPHEGGAAGRVYRTEQYGRRIEADRTWTVYHVFTGVPAHVAGRTMTGLSRLEATHGMLSLNRGSGLSLAPHHD